MLDLTRRSFVTAAASLCLARPAFAIGHPVSTGSNGVAIQGYDPHAYWGKGAAHMGDPSHMVEWRGAAWQFSTATEAEMFAATPARFAPQFGGFCTRAMSFKKVVDSDPMVWRIFEAKLYLFARPKGGKAFDKDAATIIAKAQAHWDTLG